MLPIRTFYCYASLPLFLVLGRVRLFWKKSWRQTEKSKTIWAVDGSDKFISYGTQAGGYLVRKVMCTQNGISMAKE